MNNMHNAYRYYIVHHSCRVNIELNMFAPPGNITTTVHLKLPVALTTNKAADMVAETVSIRIRLHGWLILIVSVIVG